MYENMIHQMNEEIDELNQKLKNAALGGGFNPEMDNENKKLKEEVEKLKSDLKHAAQAGGGGGGADDTEILELKEKLAKNAEILEREKKMRVDLAAKNKQLTNEKEETEQQMDALQENFNMMMGNYQDEMAKVQQLTEELRKLKKK